MKSVKLAIWPGKYAIRNVSTKNSEVLVIVEKKHIRPDGTIILKELKDEVAIIFQDIADVDNGIRALHSIRKQLKRKESEVNGG